MDHQPPQPNESSTQNDGAPLSDTAHSYATGEFRRAGLPLRPAAPAAYRPEAAAAARPPGGKRNSPVLQPRASSRPPVTGTALALRSTPSTQQCPSCGATQATSTSVCMACGTFLPTKSQQIRCRRCGRHASANLVLCPGCGRELEAAAPRPLSWLVPVVLVLLFLLFVQQWVGLGALTWSRTQMAAGWQWITEVGERLDPQVTIETIPVDAVAAELVVAEPGETNTLAGLLGEPLVVGTNGTGTNPPTESSTAPQSANANYAAVPISTTVDSGAVTGEGATAIVLQNAPRPLALEPSPTVAPTVAATATAEPTATTAPTATAEPTATTEPTATAEPTVTTAPTATATNRTLPASGEPLVQVNATATRAAERTATMPATVTATGVVLASTADSVDRVTAAADDAPPQSEQQVVASILQPTPSVAPSATSTPAPTPVPPTSTPTPVVTTYQIRAGDTPLGIAGRFDIGVNELLAANGLTVADARRLRVGRELLIPILGETTQPVTTNTPTATTTATANSGTATAAPAATATPLSARRLDAPQLRSPESGTALSCGGENSLIWLPVSFMREGDRYLLHLGFLSGYNTDGSESVTWVLEQLQPVNATIWRLDEGLCGLSPQEFGRQWRWYVEVVESAGTAWQPVSLPSTIWAFSWN